MHMLSKYVNSRRRMTMTIESMLQIHHQRIVLLGIFIPLATGHPSDVGRRIATDKQKYRSAGCVKFGIGEVKLTPGWCIGATI